MTKLSMHYPGPPSDLEEFDKMPKLSSLRCKDTWSDMVPYERHSQFRTKVFTIEPNAAPLRSFIGSHGTKIPESITKVLLCPLSHKRVIPDALYSRLRMYLEKAFKN